MRKGGTPENLKPCRKGETHNPNGRPPNQALRNLERLYGRKWVRKFQEGTKHRKEEVETWYQALLAMSHEEILLLSKDGESNIIGKAKALAILIDQKNGRTSTIDGIVNRLFGELPKKVEVEGKGLEPITIDIIDSRDKVITDVKDAENTND